MSVSSFRGKTKIKIVLLGDQNVGKTSIIERYIHDKFDESQNPTIGIDFVVSNVQKNNKNYRLQLWDTAGQQRFKSLIPSYLKDANCAIILYDVSNKDSSINTFKWLEMYNQHKEQNAFSIFVGNKIDLKSRFENQQQMKNNYQKQYLYYMQVSAKSGQNIKQLFQKIINITQENSKKNILQKDILQLSNRIVESPRQTTNCQTNKCFATGMIKLNNTSKVQNTKKQQKKKINKCC